MLGWALATFVKGMKIRLRKNWLSILAERKFSHSRNWLWCDELMINYDRYVLCCVWRSLCNQECMNEWACITFCIRRGVWGWQGGKPPPPPPPPYGFGLWFFFVFFGLSAQSRTVMMIIPLPHYGNNFATKKIGRKNCVRVPPPPPPPPFALSVVFRAGAMLSTARHFASIVEVLLALLTWCGVIW